MTRSILIPIALLTLTVPAVPAFAQATTPAPDTRHAMHVNLLGQYRGIRGLLTRAAEAMPEDGYGFKPTAEMRTFGATILHAAASNYGFCANLLRTTRPVDPASLDASTMSRAQILETLAASFAYCDGLLTTVEAGTLTETYSATRRGPDGSTSQVQVEIGGLLSTYLSHQNEVYGYSAVYLRLRGIVPPSSAPRPAGRGGAAGR